MSTMIDNVLKNMKWLGHSGFLIHTEGKALYIDPYKVQDGLPPADIIFVTHEHYDHCSVEDIDKLTKSETIIVTEKDSAKKLKGNVKVMQVGDTTEVEGITVTAVPAYNINKKFHPKKKWLAWFCAEPRRREALSCRGYRLY